MTEAGMAANETAPPRTASPADQVRAVRWRFGNARCDMDRSEPAVRLGSRAGDYPIVPIRGVNLWPQTVMNDTPSFPIAKLASALPIPVAQCFASQRLDEVMVHIRSEPSGCVSEVAVADTVADHDSAKCLANELLGNVITH